MMSNVIAWTGPYGQPRRSQPKTEAERTADRERWIAIRKEGKSIIGTPGETYLLSRGQRPDITLYPPTGWPSAFRWSDDLIRKPTPPVKSGIIIDVRSPLTGEVTGIHRIIFKRDGTVEKNSDGKKAKFCLGSIWGNAVMLGDEPANADREWGIAEGVETAMACRQLYRIPVWAAVFGGNMAEIIPPSWARRIIIFADHDPFATRVAGRDCALLPRLGAGGMGGRALTMFRYCNPIAKAKTSQMF